MASTWAARKVAAGVVRAIGFDSAAEIGPNDPFTNFGYVKNNLDTGSHFPVLDTSVHTPAGAGSMRFEINPFLGADSAGIWYCNFTDDGSRKFGQNETFFVQWRQRFDAAFLSQFLFEQKPLWTASATFNFNDECFWNGVYYRSLANGNVNHQPPNATWWSMPYESDPIAAQRGPKIGGIKQLDVVGGDYLVWNGTKWSSATGDGGYGFSSSSNIKIVTQSDYNYRFTKLYHYDLDFNNADMYQIVAGPDWWYQNQRTPPGSYSSTRSNPDGTNFGDCFGWYPNEWMTFQLMVQLGPEATALDSNSNPVPIWQNSEVKLWCAREGGVQELVHWYRVAMGADYRQLNRKPESEAPTRLPYFGKMTLFPYVTSKDSQHQNHPVMTTWYDELIVSTQFIDDPSDAVRTPIGDKARIKGRRIVPPATGTLVVVENKDIFAAQQSGAGGSFPAWRQGLAVGQWHEITGPGVDTRLSTYYTPNTAPVADPDATFSGWNGLTRFGYELWTAAASGHEAWYNAVLKIDLSQNSPQWVVVDQGSVYADTVINADYYSDGRACGRHQYYNQHAVPAGVMADGKRRILHVTRYTGWGGYGGLEGGDSKAIWGYRCDDGGGNQWDAAGTYPPCPNPEPGNLVIASCQHPTNYKIYTQWGQSAQDPGHLLNEFDPAIKTWRTVYTTPGWPATNRIDAWNDSPTIFDVVRNRLVAFPAQPSPLRMEYVQFGSNAGTSVDPCPVTVVPVASRPTLNEAGIVHVYNAAAGQDYYLLMRQTGSGTAGSMWSVNPTTGVFTSLGALGPVLLGTDQVLQKMHYIDALGGCVTVSRHNRHVWFYPTR